MIIKPGTHIKINTYYDVIRPDSATSLVGQEGIIESHYISEYIVKIGQYRYSVPREAFDIIESSSLVHVGFKHFPPTKSGRDLWELYVDGQRRTVKSPELLNLLTLRHEISEYETLQPAHIPCDFVEALLNQHKGREWLQTHPKQVHAITNISTHKRPLMASLG